MPMEQRPVRFSCLSDFPHPYTHPDHLAAMAILHGFLQRRLSIAACLKSDAMKARILFPWLMPRRAASLSDSIWLVCPSRAERSGLANSACGTRAS